MKGDEFTNWFIYHQGLDSMYQRSGFDPKHICQPRGQLERWQSSKTKTLVYQDEISRQSKKSKLIEIDKIAGQAVKVPMCEES